MFIVFLIDLWVLFIWFEYEKDMYLVIYYIIDFYHYMGAVPLEEWTTFRLAGGAIEAALEK